MYLLLKLHYLMMTFLSWLSVDMTLNKLHGH